jgi:hypothetical protein
LKRRNRKRGKYERQKDKGESEAKRARRATTKPKKLCEEQCSAYCGRGGI